MRCLTSAVLLFGEWMICFHGFAVSSVQSLSRVWLFAAPWTAVRQGSLSITNSWSLLKLMYIESVMLSNHLILCRPLLFLPSGRGLPSIRVFFSESVLYIRWPKYWSFSFSISPSSKYSVLISFWIDWFDLRASQQTLKSLPQHHISKASVLWRSAFFMVPGFAVKPVITLFVYWKFTRWGKKGKFIWPGDFSFPGWPLLVLSQFPYLTASALSTPASQVALVVRNPSANAGQSCPFTLPSV